MIEPGGKVKQRSILVLVLLVVFSFLLGLALPVSAQPAPNPAPAGEPAGDFKLGGLATTTIYYKPILKLVDYPCKPEEKKPLIDTDGNVLIKVCETIYKKCLMQGSCNLEVEGKLLSYNYHSEIEGVRRFTQVKLSRCPYGLGSSNQCLDPFYTVAADLKFHKEGDVIFVPLVLGVKLPSGESHSGFFVVRDSGEAIVGEKRFDFFTGFMRFGTTVNPFSRLGLDQYKDDVVFYTVSGDLAKKVQQLRKYPSLPEALTKQKPLNLEFVDFGAPLE